MALSIYNSSLITDANLVNYYRLNGDALDYKAAANGTATGSPTYSDSFSPFLDGSKGIFFNNVFDNTTAAQYITASFLAPGAANFTYYYWSYYISNPAGTTHRPVCNEENGATGRPRVSFTCGTNISGEAGTSASTVSVASADATLVGVWYQVAYTRSGDTQTLYVNGVSKGTTSLSGTYSSIANGNIGRRFNSSYSTAQQPFRGYMADVAMFSRALSATELLNLYTGTFNSTLVNKNNLRPHVFSPGRPR